MNKIKLGIVGVRRGDAYIKAFNLGTRSEITAVCDLNPENAYGAAKEMGLSENQCFTDFDEFLNEDMDAIAIVTPIPLHEEQVVKALEAGKDVFSEVTMANTVEGCIKIYETVKKTGRKYMMAENYIYLDFIQQWKKYIEDGRIGRIHYAEAEYVHDIRNRLYYDGTREGETFWRTYRPPIHYCTHCLGPVMYLMGDGDYIVKATGWGNKNTIVKDLWPSTIDMQVGIFETMKGRTVKILRSQVTPRNPHIVTYNIYGTEGSLETGRTPGYDTIGTRYFAKTDKEAVPMNCNGTRLDCAIEHKQFKSHGTSDYYGAQAFLDYLEFGKEPYTTVDVAAELTLPGIIAHEACVEGYVWKEVPHLS